MLFPVPVGLLGLDLGFEGAILNLVMLADHLSLTCLSLLVISHLDTLGIHSVASSQALAHRVPMFTEVA